MPTFKYGARTFHAADGPRVSTTANQNLEAWSYLPAVSDTGTFDKAAEMILSGTLTFFASVGQTVSTSGSSMQIVAYQINSAASTVNSAVLFDQSLGSQAAFVPIDTTLLHLWTLSPGDLLLLAMNSHTVSNPASAGLVWSVNVGAPPG